MLWDVEGAVHIVDFICHILFRDSKGCKFSKGEDISLFRGLISMLKVFGKRKSSYDKSLLSA